MFRFVLTLLAFLSGLSAIGPSAEARACGLGGAEIGAVEALSQGERVAVRQQGPPAPRAGHASVGRAASCFTPQQPAVHVPTVLFGPDRARE